MKIIYTFLCIFFLSTVSIFSQEPTDAGIPDANHVLVVYNSNSDTSLLVANYYQSARNIPTDNIVSLTLPDSIEITIDNETHWVGIRQETDIIRDIYQHNIKAVTPTFHAWRYYLDYVATPIKNWITSHNLSSIRYVCLVKGVPCKIQAAGDWALLGTSGGNVTVDGLLCMLNTDNYEDFIDSVYKHSLPNPYYGVDPNFNMEYRFLPDHFTTSWQGYTVKLSYLVSHLDGISYDVVKGIIDKSLEPDMSGTAAWIIDDDLTWSGGHFADARDKLEELSFTVVFDNSDTWITSYDGNVMGYTSWGTHAEDGNCAWDDSAWVKDSLHFNLSNGSVFNTYESFNGNSLTTLNWRYIPNIPPDCHHTQGLATQFTEIGGTGTMGHAWEPGGGHVIDNSIFFPAYAVGYNLVDAIYQGVVSLAHQNVIVGDPLVRIYECDNTIISSNTTIGSGDYYCNVIVPQNVTLTIESGSVVNFKRNAQLKIYGTLEIEENAELNFDSYSELRIESSGNFIENSGASLTFNNYSTFRLDSYYRIENISALNFKDQSKFIINGELNINGTDLLTFNNYSMIKVTGKMYLPQGSEIYFNDYSFLLTEGTIISQGTEQNNIIFNFPASSQGRFWIQDADTVIINYTTINNNGVKVVYLKDEINIDEYVSITNSSFENCITAIDLSVKNIEIIPPLISNVNINNCYGTGIQLIQVPETAVENTGIHLNSEGDNGILLFNNGIVNIADCNLTGGSVGIVSKVKFDPESVVIEELETDIYINQCVFENCTTGVLIDDQTAPYEAVTIYANHFDNCKYGIEVNEFSDYSPNISENIISGNSNGSAETGIILTNGDEVIVSDNSITNFLTGINLNLVNTPHIINNFISAEYLNAEPGPGLLYVSSDGELRKNTVQYHSNGIEIGSSSPKCAENNINNNNFFGIYISDGSFPNLSKTIVGSSEYPLTGYNTIRENGLCDNDNAEIFFNEGGADLHLGCNTIADDRANGGGCDYTYLMDGVSGEEIEAEENYWGDHPVFGHNPEDRFGVGISVLFDPYLEEACTFSSGESFLVLTTTEGDIIDTVHSSGSAPADLTDLQARYKAADEYFYSHQYQAAIQELNGIIQNYGNNTSSLAAYKKLYTILSLTNSPTGAFNELKSFYLQKAGNQTDSIMIKTLTHLGDLCLVSAAEYLNAINNFEQEAQQHPNTDISFYREIDALTTALMIEDSTMLKGSFVKYKVSGLSDYTNKLSQLIKNRGLEGERADDDLVPKEYVLYQNYPNPFNPVTTIKYDLPKGGIAELIIYDILGRKVRTLVNEHQQPGRYEIRFDASNLASGVYIYQIKADDFVRAKKMILLK